MKKLGVVMMLLIILCTFSGCEDTANNATINLITEFNGEEIDLCDKTVREYLNEKNENEQSDIIYKYTSLGCTYQNAVFKWDSDGSTNYKVYFSDNKKMENALVYETNDISIYNEVSLVPGKTYYWKVEGDTEGSTSKVDTFKTKDAPVRYITTDGIINVRDIGGWKAGDKKVKYEQIYRGGKTNTIGDNICSDIDYKLFREELGIHTEIDLRTAGHDDGNQTRSVFGNDVNYLKASMGGYNYILPGFSQSNPKRNFDSTSTTSIRRIFDILGDEKNYPVYFHCNAGADRTGTLAFLINGVLGVVYEDLTRDFELTSFSKVGKRYRSNINELDHSFDETGVMQDDDDNYVAWGYFYEQLMKDYGQDGDLQKAIEKYLINTCHVDKEDIEILKKMMLE